jgi:hypothetical protein
VAEAESLRIEKAPGLFPALFPFPCFSVQLVQMVPQSEIDIAGDGAVIILSQTLDPLIDRVVECDTDSDF